MDKENSQIIEKLGKQLLHLNSPIHLLGVCSGGKAISKPLKEYLEKNEKNVTRHKILINRNQGKCSLWETDFTKESYTGTAIIVDDAIWTGKTISPIKEMLKEMNPQKKFYIATLIDYGTQADFTAIRFKQE